MVSRRERYRAYSLQSHQQQSSPGTQPRICHYWIGRDTTVISKLTSLNGKAAPTTSCLGSRNYSYGLLNENLAGVDEGAREHSRRARAALETDAALFQFREHLPEQNAKIVRFSVSRPASKLLHYAGTDSVADAVTATTQLERPLLRDQLEAAIQGLLEPFSLLRLSIPHRRKRLL